MPEITPSTGHTDGESQDDVVDLVGPQGRSLRMMLLHTDTSDERTFKVISSFNLMRVFIQCIDRIHSYATSVTELEALLKQAGVIRGIDHDALELLVALFDQSSDDINAFQVARGTPPEPGCDGEVEFLVHPTSSSARYDTDEDGNIDYHELNLIANCVKDQHVATLHPPGSGNPGMDVLGKVLPTAMGKPDRLQLGKGVRIDDSGVKVYAESDGRLVLEGGALSLTDLYEVNGDVDYKVGNIDFIGSVVIKKGVQSGFNVRAKKGIKIFGNVESCILESEGDILIHGGIKGNDKGKVIINGKLTAKYLDHVEVESYGDVSVEREIVGSNVRTTQCVKIPNGAIVSGSVVAFHGIEAKTVGTELGTITQISAGIDWTNDDKIEALEVKIAEIERKIDAVEEAVGPILNSNAAMLQFSDEEKDLVTQLINELTLLRKELIPLNENHERLADQRQEGRVSQLNVQGKLHAGTRIRFSHNSLNIKTTHKGPLSVIQDEKKNTIRTVSCFELTEDESENRQSKITELH